MSMELLDDILLNQKDKQAKSFWRGVPRSFNGRDVFSNYEIVFLLFTSNNEFIYISDINSISSKHSPGMFLTDLITTNDSYYLYKMFSNGVLRIVHF